MQKVQLSKIFTFSFLLIIVLEGVSTVNGNPLRRGQGPNGSGNGNGRGNGRGRGFGRGDRSARPPTVRVSLNDDEEIVTVPNVTGDLKQIVVESTKEVSNAKVLDDVNWACFFAKAEDWTPSSPPSPSLSVTRSGRDDYTVISRTFSYDADPNARERFEPPFQFKYLSCFRLPSPSRVNDEMILFVQVSVRGFGLGLDIKRFPLPPYGFTPSRAHIKMNDLSMFNSIPTLRRSAIVYAPPRGTNPTCYALDREPIPQETFLDGVTFSPGNPFEGGLENWLGTACAIDDPF